MSEFEGIPAETPDYTDQPLVSYQQVYDQLERIAQQTPNRGPMLKELRCAQGVRIYLSVVLPNREYKLWEPQPLGVPLIEDGEVPARMLRLVYSDDTSRDVEIIREVKLEDAFPLPDVFEFRPPPMPNWSRDYFRWGFYAGGGV